jgi:hypothetical protein
MQAKLLNDHLAQHLSYGVQGHSSADHERNSNPSSEAVAFGWGISAARHDVLDPLCSARPLLGRPQWLPLESESLFDRPVPTHFLPNCRSKEFLAVEDALELHHSMFFAAKFGMKM